MHILAIWYMLRPWLLFIMAVKWCPLIGDLSGINLLDIGSPQGSPCQPFFSCVKMCEFCDIYTFPQDKRYSISFTIPRKTYMQCFMMTSIIIIKIQFVNLMTYWKWNVEGDNFRFFTMQSKHIVEIWHDWRLQTKIIIV